MFLASELEMLLSFFSEEENMFICLGAVVGIVGIVFGSVTSIVRNVARERTRREIAAYIAEGSMTPEQGERLMKVGKA